MHSSISARLNLDLLDEKYAIWKAGGGLDAEWSAFFEGFEIGTAQLKKKEDVAAETARLPEAAPDESSSGMNSLVTSMVYHYRILGHTQAWLNPLSTGPQKNDRLSLETLGFSETDLDSPVQTRFFKGEKSMTLRDMIQWLQSIYCQWIGYEFMHIHNNDVRHWLRDRIESRSSEPVSKERKLQILQWLVEAESFERFLHKKYVGQKRFSLEGGEALMVSLGTILDSAPDSDMKRIVMGMAHRGRLNVLANFLRKPLTVILYEFSENYVPNVAMGDGDVKYHLGFETERNVGEEEHPVAISLAANPSHLEAVNAVVEGKARARQRESNLPNDESLDRGPILPVLIHGDAAFAGQGSVAEVLNLSQLPGYRTGGTIHLIVNNQVGFTTTPEDARSSSYCTDVAKMIEAPIFHVNGDHPLEVAFVTEMAVAFRNEFKRDVVIDIVCYRRHGHNEGDEPAFTLPELYRSIQTHPSVTRLFAEELVESGEVSEDEVKSVHREFDLRINEEYDQLKEHEKKGDSHALAGSAAVIQPEYTHDPVRTGISEESLLHIGKTLADVPEGFKANPKLLKRFVEPRRKAVENGGSYNWAYAEALAFGSLLTEGYSVRLSGQDCRRGTFSQRHAVIYDTETRERWFPLRHLADDQGSFYVYNSLLSEVAVLGFEYGYSMVARDMLVLWEAQFGDFANGAQMIIDQFIVSAESKWAQPSNLVLLLPHGYEGMGPEHSSARPERFLQLCAENNIQVCNLTKPAQYFHLLRRQMHRTVRKPLILMTPKSLLGHPQCISHNDDFTGDSSFQEFIDDDQLVDKPNRVTRLIFCAGKVYYDLLNYRNKHELKNVAIIRVEQFYPFNQVLLEKIVGRYPRANKKWVWCQEEPLNMGGWSFMGPRLQTVAEKVAGGHVHLRYAGRDRAASTAAGAKAIHVREQERLVEDAFNV